MDENLKIDDFTIYNTGKSFELSNTNFLDISLESTEEIKLCMNSQPKIVTIALEKANKESGDMTIITLNGLESNAIYYKYTDSFLNMEEFTADDNGSFKFEQDLTNFHNIFIKETPSTIYIKEDGWYNNATKDPTIGDWNPKTRVAKLKVNVSTLIEIATDQSKPLILDGNKRLVKALGNIGLYIPSIRHSITIKNFIFESCNTAIYLSYGVTTTIIESNNFINNLTAIYLYASSFNTIRNNIIRSNVTGSSGIYLYSIECGYNTVDSNEIRFENMNDVSNRSISGYGIRIYDAIFNIIKNNKIYFLSNYLKNDYVYLSGLLLRCSNNTIEKNQILIKNNNITTKFTNELTTINLSSSQGNLINNNLLKILDNTMFGPVQYNSLLAGIYLSNSNHGNTISENTIFVKSNTLTNITNSLISLIYSLSGNDCNTIERNTLTHSQGNGIAFDNSSDSCLISNNFIAYNHLYGINFIYIENGWNKITCNTFKNNSLGGLFISNYNVNNYIVNNNFKNAPGKNAFNSQLSDNNYFNSNYWSDYNHITPCYNVNNVHDCNPLNHPLPINVNEDTNSQTKCDNRCNLPM